jgi:hypothetical protein
MSQNPSKNPQEPNEPTTTSSTPPKAGDDVESSLSPKRKSYWCNQWFSDIGWEQQNTKECRRISERVMEHTKQFSCPQIAEEFAIRLLKKSTAVGGPWHNCPVRYMGAKQYNEKT